MYRKSPSEPRPFAVVAIILLAAVALYFIAYFPAMSCVARQFLPGGIIYAWQPLPRSVGQRMFQLWMKIDPHGENRLQGPRSLDPWEF